MHSEILVQHRCGNNITPARDYRKRGTMRSRALSIAMSLCVAIGFNFQAISKTYDLSGIHFNAGDGWKAAGAFSFYKVDNSVWGPHREWLTVTRYGSSEKYNVETF